MTHSTLYKLAFAAVAIITASVCSYMEGKIDMQAKMAHYQETVQQDFMDED